MMFAAERYRIRRFVFVEGHSRREATIVFGLSRETAANWAGSRYHRAMRRKPVTMPNLKPLNRASEKILEVDRTVPVKPPHIAKLIFERLQDEYDVTGGYAAAKNYVRIKSAQRGGVCQDVSVQDSRGASL